MFFSQFLLVTRYFTKPIHQTLIKKYTTTKSIQRLKKASQSQLPSQAENSKIQNSTKQTNLPTFFPTTFNAPVQVYMHCNSFGMQLRRVIDRVTADSPSYHDKQLTKSNTCIELHRRKKTQLTIIITADAHVHKYLSCIKVLCAKFVIARAIIRRECQGWILSAVPSCVRFMVFWERFERVEHLSRSNIVFGNVLICKMTTNTRKRWPNIQNTLLERSHNRICT